VSRDCLSHNAEPRLTSIISGQVLVETAGVRDRSRRGCQDCLVKQVILERMATAEPLSPTEEVLWRAVMRMVKVIPRHLDSDLIRDAGVTASDYTTIMHLSEAPNRELRMADLATATDLSASRMTRLVDELQSRGLVTKTASSSDARGNVAKLTPLGMAKLKSAWPVHLASVRSRFFDHLDASTLETVARALSEVAAHLEDTPTEPRVPR
jgi:DNA-binding MarR family transcriptional regulator